MPEAERLSAGPVAISWVGDFESAARVFAREHKLPIINELAAWGGLCFELGEHGWILKEAEDLSQKPFQLTFQSRYIARGKDPLLKAMGSARSVLDLTAGWGGDALHIASSGRSVVSIERHPVVYRLLEQAREKLDDAMLKDNLRFILADATDSELKQKQSVRVDLPDSFDLVYMDPMFAEKRTSQARSRKPIQMLQQLTSAPSSDNTPENERHLLNVALEIATKRVVVKRALKAPYIDGRLPQGSIKSKLLRFDLYLPR